MSTSNPLTRPVVVLKPPRLNKPLLMFAKAVHNAMLDNPNFPNPNPTLVVFAANIAAFEEAETKAATRTRGATALRDARKQRVKGDLAHLCDYVQKVVETDVSPADAAALAESAFMRVKKVPTCSVPELRVKNAGVSGKVTLAAKAVARSAIYFWEYSLDQSTWTSVPETLQARTEVSGLTSACDYFFRFRAFTRAGRQDYSQVVRLLVV